MKIARKLRGMNDPAVVIEVTSFECALYSLPAVCLLYPIILHIIRRVPEGNVKSIASCCSCSE